MSQQQTDPMSLAAYWSRISQVFAVQHSTYRTPVLETILQADSDVYTFAGLKQAIDEYLETNEVEDADTEWSNATLTDILPYLEDVGVIQRIPKVEKDTDYASYRIGAVCDWLREQDLNAGSPQSMPEGKAACMVDYVGGVLSELDAGEQTAMSVEGYPEERISVVPTEASIYTVAQQVGNFRDSNVEIGIGNLSSLRGTAYEELLESLELGTELPAEDGSWQTSDGVHDFAAAGVITGLVDCDDKQRLYRQIRSYLGMIHAGAWKLNEAADDGSKYGRIVTGDETIRELLGKDGQNAAMKRTGFDVQIIDEKVRFGSYTRRSP